MRWRGIAALIVAALVAGPVAARGQDTRPAPQQVRLFVLSDIGGDPDDKMSLVRLMTYANQFRIEGLVATRNSGGLFPEQIARVVTAYGQVRDNLELHEPGYPDAAALAAVIARGNAASG